MCLYLGYFKFLSMIWGVVVKDKIGIWFDAFFLVLYVVGLFSWPMGVVIFSLICLVDSIAYSVHDLVANNKIRWRP